MGAGELAVRVPSDRGGRGSTLNNILTNTWVGEPRPVRCKSYMHVNQNSSGGRSAGFNVEWSRRPPWGTGTVKNYTPHGPKVAWMPRKAPARGAF